MKRKSTAPVVDETMVFLLGSVVDVIKSNYLSRLKREPTLKEIELLWAKATRHLRGTEFPRCSESEII